MADVVVALSIACGAGSLGALIALHLELRACRKDLLQRVKEFDEVTRKASEANLSMGEKLLQVDERLASLEFKITAQTVAGSMGWKK